MKTAELYHERQSRQLCALHVLNNLLQVNDSWNACSLDFFNSIHYSQEKAFTKAQLDEICLQLTPSYWMNPHRSPLGLGNYDVNVMIAALQLRNLQVVWFDKRKWVRKSQVTFYFY